MNNYLRISCPHCASDVVIDLKVSEVRVDKSRGSAPYDLGPEVDAYVLDKIDNKGLSFYTLAELLEERNILTVRGNAKWNAGIARRLYLGALSRKENREQANPNSDNNDQN